MRLQILSPRARLQVEWSGVEWSGVEWAANKPASCIDNKLPPLILPRRRTLLPQ